MDLKVTDTIGKRMKPGRTSSELTPRLSAHRCFTNWRNKRNSSLSSISPLIEFSETKLWTLPILPNSINAKDSSQIEASVSLT